MRIKCWSASLITKLLAPQTLKIALLVGGVLAGVGYLGLCGMVLQDSARARKST